MIIRRTPPKRKAATTYISGKPLTLPGQVTERQACASEILLGLRCLLVLFVLFAFLAFLVLLALLALFVFFALFLFVA